MSQPIIAASALQIDVDRGADVGRIENDRFLRQPLEDATDTQA